MVMNEEIDMLNRVFHTSKGLLFYTHHEGCILDDGKKDPTAQQITDGVMIEFKENREDGPYFIYTSNFGIEEEVRLLGILGTRAIPNKDNTELLYILEFHPCLSASPVALVVDDNVVTIAERTVNLTEVNMDLYKASEQAMGWLIEEYRKYFKDLFPK